MKKFLAVFFGVLAKRFGAEEITKDSYLCHKETNPIQVQNERPKKEAKTPKKIKKQKKKQYHGKK